jgi:putative sterol carrier protein
MAKTLLQILMTGRSKKMNTRVMDSNFKYYLAYSEEKGYLPILYGYADIEERDNAYLNYLVTGEIEILDLMSGNFTLIKPVLLGKLDLIDGKWVIREQKNNLVH